MTNNDSKPNAVGIDLGTTFSAISYLDIDGKPQTIRNSEGELTTPSAVFFDKSHPVVGVEAIEAGLQEPQRLAMYAKRDVGEQSYEKLIRGEALPPEVVQAIILKKLVSDAESKLGKIENAVITVPAFFNEPCRKATQDAGRLIGLNVLDIINEPTAAAITYGVEHGFLNEDGTSDQTQRVLVYDLGGGTFDVTVMEITGSNYRAIATAGDVYLGGIDWDERIAEHVAEQFILEFDSDPREDPMVALELLKKATQAKHALSQRDECSIFISHEGHRFKETLTREKFEFISSDLVDRTLMTVKMVLADSGHEWTDFSRVMLVGGSTRMPMIQRAVEDASGLHVDRSLSPDEAVSHGAAIYAGLLLKLGTDRLQGMSVRNVNSNDLGILAVETETGRPRRQLMIPRNTSLPAERQVRFKTHEENQTNVRIQIIEGGDDSGNNATHIGKCVVDGIPVGLPQGTPVDVQFQYQSDGRLKVTAEIPEVDRRVRLLLNREAGLRDTFDFWRERIEQGLPDNSVPTENMPNQPTMDVTEPLPAEPIPTAEPKVDSKPKPKKVLKKKAKASDSLPAEEKAASEAAPDVSETPPSFPDFSSLKKKK